MIHHANVMKYHYLHNVGEIDLMTKNIYDTYDMKKTDCKIEYILSSCFVRENYAFLSGSITNKRLTLGQKKKSEFVSWLVAPPAPFSHSSPGS